MGQANYSVGEGRADRPDQGDRPRAGVPRHHGQRGRARVRPDRADPGPARQRSRTRSPAARRSAGSGRPRRSRTPSRSSPRDEAALHHGPGPGRRRRPGDDVGGRQPPPRARSENGTSNDLGPPSTLPGTAGVAVATRADGTIRTMTARARPPDGGVRARQPVRTRATIPPAPRCSDACCPRRGTCALRRRRAPGRPRNRARRAARQRARHRRAARRLARPRGAVPHDRRRDPARAPGRLRHDPDPPRRPACISRPGPGCPTTVAVALPVVRRPRGLGRRGAAHGSGRRLDRYPHRPSLRRRALRGILEFAGDLDRAAAPSRPGHRGPVRGQRRAARLDRRRRRVPHDPGDPCRRSR